MSFFVNFRVRLPYQILQFSFGGGKEDLLGRIFIWSSGVVPWNFVWCVEKGQNRAMRVSHSLKGGKHDRTAL